MGKFTESELPKKDGSLRGDTAGLPMKTEGSMSPASYGSDLGPEATNRQGSIAGSTKSDAMDKCHSRSERV